MTLSITLDLPEPIVEQLESTSRNQRRSVGDLIREIVIQNWQPLPRLPDDVEAELAAFPSLSNEVLWLLARSTLTSEEQNTLALLNGATKIRTLEAAEVAHRCSSCRSKRRPSGARLVPSSPAPGVFETPVPALAVAAGC